MSLSYVDFVIRMKNGQIFLFDTKSENSASEASYKHNGLVEYMELQRKKGLQIDGGVIIGDGDLWHYSVSKIENTMNVVGWKGFFPRRI